uniref:Cyclic nucleotide-binding domain-containing protein n=1 Tax=Caenorhabditis japonica TaxID=281687 RepID=A0A8R1DVL1_CAEJA
MYNRRLILSPIPIRAAVRPTSGLTQNGRRSGRKEKIKKLDLNKGKVREPWQNANNNAANGTSQKSFADVVNTFIFLKTLVTSYNHESRESEPERDLTITNAIDNTIVSVDDQRAILGSQEAFQSHPTGLEILKEFLNDNYRRIIFFTVNKSSTFFYYWSSLISVGILYNMFAMVIFIFDDVQQGYFTLWMGLNIFFDVCFALDCVVGSRITFVSDGNEVRQTGRTFKNYRQSTRFKWDLLSLAPVDLILIIYAHVSLIRVIRMAKAYRLYEFVVLTEKRTDFPHFMKILFLTTSCAVLFHWNACVYFLFSLFEGLSEDDANAFGFSYYKVFDPRFPTCEPLVDERCWYPENTDVLDLRDERHKYMYDMYAFWEEKYTLLSMGNFSREYSMTIYWSSLTITKCGQQPWPSTSPQNSLEIFDTLIGVLVFATIIGSVGNVVTQMSQNVNDFREMMDGIKFYMKYREVQAAIQDRVLACFLYLNAQNQLYDEQDFPIVRFADFKYAICVIMVPWHRVFRYRHPNYPFIHWKNQVTNSLAVSANRPRKGTTTQEGGANRQGNFTRSSNHIADQREDSSLIQIPKSHILSEQADVFRSADAPDISDVSARVRLDLPFTHLSRFSYDTKTQKFTFLRTRRSHLCGRTSTNVWFSPGSFSSQVQIIFERHPYWFIAKYRTVERVLSEPQPFMELGRDYDITKKNPVMANGLMRPVLIRTQQIIPLQLARGIRLGHHRQRFMRLTDALSQGWMVHPVAKEVLPWKDSWHEMLRAGRKLAPSTLTTATTPLRSLAQRQSFNTSSHLATGNRSSSTTAAASQVLIRGPKRRVSSPGTTNGPNYSNLTLDNDRTSGCCEPIRTPHQHGQCQSDGAANIAWNLHSVTLKGVALFDKCDSRFLQEVVLLVKQQVYSPNDYLCRKNEKAKEMFIVKKGTLSVIDDDTGIELDQLKEGSTFGELSIVHVKGNLLGDRRSVSLRSLGFSDVYVLHQDDVSKLLQEYPEDRALLLNNGSVHDCSGLSGRSCT